MKKIFLILFALLFLISFTIAQPPFVEEGAVSFLEGYFVEFTPIGTYEQNNYVLFNAHVFNISNGARINLDTTDCHIHLFDQRGEHFINQINMTYDPVGLDWEYNATGGNFTRIGDYSYLIVCEARDKTFGGFVAIEFRVTPTGQTFDTPQGLVTLGLLLILMFLSGAFLFFGMKIEYIPFKIFLTALGSLFLLVMVGVSLNAINELMLVGSVFAGMFVNLYRLMLILVSAGGIGLMLYIVYMSVKQFYSHRGLLDKVD